jgi:hypothetical protein
MLKAKPRNLLEQPYGSPTCRGPLFNEIIGLSIRLLAGIAFGEQDYDRCVTEAT